MRTANIFKMSVLVLFTFALIKPIFDAYKHQPQPLPEKAQPKKKPKLVEHVEKPLHNVKLPEFAEIRDVKQKKRQFFNFLRPAIDAENTRIYELRIQIKVVLDKLEAKQPITTQESELITTLIKKYKVAKRLSPLNKVQELANRIDVVPNELVLVQAANESAWGTSRFARIGLNFFGIWCYKKGCGMVPKGRDKGLKHEVAAFDSVEQAVSHYLLNINTNAAYVVFRTIRAQLHQQNQPLSAQILATGLLPYSQRGTDYVLEISDMIRHNQVYFDEGQTE